VAGLHDKDDMILLVGILQYFLFVEIDLDDCFESSSVSLHTNYLILIIFNWDEPESIDKC
jgi:hypothetical protein